MTGGISALLTRGGGCPRAGSTSKTQGEYARDLSRKSQDNPYHQVMKKQFASGITTLAVGLVVWAVTTSLQLLDPIWRISIALGVALAAGFCVYLLSKSSQNKKKQEVLSHIRAGQDATFHDIEVSNVPRGKSTSVASHISAGRDAQFKNIDVGKETTSNPGLPTLETEQKRTSIHNDGDAKLP